MTGMKDLNPIQNRVPALQYLDSVEAGSVADRAGLQPGDFILAVSCPFFSFYLLDRFESHEPI
jgi:predicted metalloprotease with PDZ domain